MEQNQHICRGYLDDFKACLQCGVNQINCKQCFDIKHKTDGKKHKAQNLRESDVYQQFQKFINLQWLTAQFLMKGLVSYQFSRDDMKKYMTSNIFYESTFFNQTFKQDIVKFEYKILKTLSQGQACQFYSLQHLQRILNDAQTNDLILNYVSQLLNEGLEDTNMIGQIDYLNKVHISQFQVFFERQQLLFGSFLYKLLNKQDQSITEQEKIYFKKIDGVFSVQNYVKWREQIIKEERDPINYTRQFIAFLFDYYKKQASQKGIFTLRDYVHNFWENFHTCIQVNSNLKEFIEQQIKLYKNFEAEMKVSKFKITLLGYKVWKLNYVQTKQLTYLKNHFLLNQFLQGYIRMLIQRTYLFLTVDERDEVNKQHWTDYVKFMKDYCLFTENDEAFFDFRSYKVYYLFRKRLFGFTRVIQKDKQYQYNDEWVQKFFDNQFLNQSKKVNLESYHQFVKKILQQEQKKKEQLKQNIENLRNELKQQQKQNFYESVFLNFVVYCQQKQLKVKKQTYFQFKKRLFETVDQKYIQQTEQRFQRGDYNQPLQVDEDENDETEQIKVTQTISQIDGHKVKIIEGINKEQQRILVANQEEGEVSEEQEGMEMCLCCHGDPYNCKNQECQIMGCCAMCCF